MGSYACDWLFQLECFALYLCVGGRWYKVETSSFPEVGWSCHDCCSVSDIAVLAKAEVAEVSSARRKRTWHRWSELTDEIRKLEISAVSVPICHRSTRQCLFLACSVSHAIQVGWNNRMDVTTSVHISSVQIGPCILQSRKCVFFFPY